MAKMVQAHLVLFLRLPTCFKNLKKKKKSIRDPTTWVPWSKSIRFPLHRALIATVLAPTRHWVLRLKRRWSHWILIGRGKPVSSQCALPKQQSRSRRHHGATAMPRIRLLWALGSLCGRTAKRIRRKDPSDPPWPVFLSLNEARNGVGSILRMVQGQHTDLPDHFIFRRTFDS